MGTTLSNGVYLPDEGERNCYAGLKVNWEILNQKVADIVALQLAIAGALHREIVASLPTTDIDPNTIYMILNGTSATENVYNEFMYVNNAWELIGTSATDLTNYYTKAEVDGKLLLKANASDLTSHTGDTTIHVTANDKTKWTNSANTHVLRLALSALTPSTSDNSFSNLDDATALKVGDKVMDTAGVLFEVTAIDTQNSTFTIGTALIDLAQDSDVMHKSGNETVGGVKSFINYFLGKDLSGQTVNLNDCVDAYGGAIHYYYAVSNYTNISNKPENKPFILESKTVRYVSSADYIYYQKIYTADYNATPSIYTRYYRSGSASWSNWIKDTDKFVTTDTAQTISGNKTFSSNTFVYNSDTNATTPSLYLKSSKIEISSQGNTSGDQNLTYLDKNSTAYAFVKGAIQSNGSAVKIRAIAKDSSDNSVINELQMLAYTNGNKAIFPTYSNEIDLGVSNYKWKSFNGVEPSSLSLPSDNISDIIDISSYLSILDGSNANTYVAPANGWISITMNSCSGIQAYITGLWGHQIVRPTTGGVRFFMPILKNKTVNILIFGGTIDNARFIPCQGNV